MNGDHMDDEDFAGLMAGMRDVADYQRGKREGFVTHVPQAVSVKAIRAARQLSQLGFARTYGFSVSAVRDWEQGRRKPERAARILLAMIDRAPETVEKVMRGI
jgi:putative transcriptional regulator